jgi:hypothetical protein
MIKPSKKTSSQNNRKSGRKSNNVTPYNFYAKSKVRSEDHKPWIFIAP